MAGNLLGPRGEYLYTSDSGAVYKYTTDESLAVAGLGAAGAAPVEFDPASPPSGYAGPFPRNFSPRVVFAQDANGNRKELIAASPTANLYATTLPQTVTIDTLSFTTKGRKGEKLSF